MEIIISYKLDYNATKGHNRCRGALETIFLSDITMADGKYLEHFVFDLGGGTKQLHFKFPKEQPTKQD